MQLTPPNSWRDLDVAQMQLWPDAPRRVFLGMCAVLLTALLGWFYLLPRYETYLANRNQTQNLQQKYEQAVQRSIQIESQKLAAQSRGEQTVRADDVSSWISAFAKTAQEHGLTNLSIKPAKETATAQNPNTPNSADKADAGKETLINQPNVGQLSVSGSSSYADLLHWLESLSQNQAILTVDEVNVQAGKEGAVAWSVRVLYEREVSK